MKKAYYAALHLLFLFTCTPPSFAQALRKVVFDRHKAIVLSGVTVQWFGQNMKSVNFSVEKDFNPYTHLGIIANFYIPEPAVGNSYYYRRLLQPGGYEIGAFCKSFLSGRLTGRKSAVYMGPEIRYGQRFTREYDGFIFPSPLTPYREYRENLFKLLFRWGWQYHIGKAVLDLGVPFGLERVSYTLLHTDDAIFSPENYNGSTLVLLPTINIGYSF